MSCFTITELRRTVRLERGGVGVPVLYLKFIPRRSLRCTLRGGVALAVCSLRVTGGLGSVSRGANVATGVRVGVSAKVDEVNFRTDRRSVSRVIGVSGLGGLCVRNVCARFTGSSRVSGSFACGRTSEFGFVISDVRGENVGVPVGRMSGDTTAVSLPSLGFGVMEYNVILCKCCPSSRIVGSGLRLGPTVALGAGMTRVGRLGRSAKVDCKLGCGADGLREVVAVPVKCTSKFAEVRGGPGMSVGGRVFSIMKEVYVSRYVMEVSGSVSVGVKSRIVVFKRDGVGTSGVTGSLKAVGCRVMYVISEEISHVCGREGMVLRTSDCLMGLGE